MLTIEITAGAAASQQIGLRIVNRPDRTVAPDQGGSQLHQTDRVDQV